MQFDANEGGAKKDRVSLLSKMDVLFRRLDKPLIKVLQGSLQDQPPPLRHGQEVGDTWKFFPKMATQRSEKAVEMGFLLAL